MPAPAWRAMSVQKYHRTVLHQWDVWHAPAAPAEREMSVQKYHRSFKYLPPYYICVYVDVCVCVLYGTKVAEGAKS